MDGQSRVLVDSAANGKSVKQAYIDVYQIDVTPEQRKCFAISHKKPSPADKQGEAYRLQVRYWVMKKALSGMKPHNDFEHSN